MEVEGIFRLAGAERRVKELYAMFDSPDKYGKGLDWTGYTVHDAANVLRRYLNQLPEPVIPFTFYHRFREPLKGHQADAVGEMAMQAPSTGDFDRNTAIKTYQQLITELPPLNRQLLLYILDLTAVFAAKSEINLMTASNLSAIFQPGLLAFREHDMSPKEYRWSQDVIIFLIENQDSFLVGMQGTAADEKTHQDMQSASSLPKSSASSLSTGSRHRVAMGRSASNASGGADSARRYGVLRRNISTGSRRSRQSVHTPSPVTPSPVTPPPDSPYSASGRASGVQRSNTVPSNHSPSPALGTTTGRFQRERSPMQASPVISGLAVQGVTNVAQQPETTISATSTDQVLEDPTASMPDNPPPSAFKPAKSHATQRLSPHLRPVADKRAPSADRQLKMEMPQPAIGAPSPFGTPSRERTSSHLFKQSPNTDDRQGRRPNKLQKKRPETGALGTRESNASLSGASQPPSPAHAPLPQAPFRNGPWQQSHITDAQRLDSSAQMLDQVNEHFELAPEVAQQQGTSIQGINNTYPDEDRHWPHQSWKQSIAHETNTTSRTQSRASHTSEDAYPPAGDAEGMHPGQTSRQERRSDERLRAKEMRKSIEGSTSSAGSGAKPRKSLNEDSNKPTNMASSSVESDNMKAEGAEKKGGPIGWFKGKLAERKERAKSPPPASRSGSEAATQSLGAIAVGDSSQQSRRLSTDVHREEKQELTQ